MNPLSRRAVLDCGFFVAAGLKITAVFRGQSAGLSILNRIHFRYSIELAKLFLAAMDRL
jgi:hypothetical protein